MRGALGTLTPRLPFSVPRVGVVLISALLLAGCQVSDGADGATGVDGIEVDDADIDDQGGSHVVRGGDGDSDPVNGSGRLTSRQLSLSGVTELAVGAGFVVRVRIGEPAQATVWMDDNLVDLVDAAVTGGRLRLGLRPNVNMRNATLSAVITVSELDRLTTSGASQVTLASELAGDTLELKASGTSRISGSLHLEQVQVSTSGASGLILSGQVGHLDLQAAGTSGLRLSRLAVRHLEAELSGASCAAVTVSDTLAARTSGTSELRYSGAPRVTRQQTSGASSIAPYVPRSDRCVL